MIYQHLGAPAALRVLVQALVDEVLELWRPLGWDARGLILNNIEEHSRVVLRDVGWLTLRQFDTKYSQWPHIYLVGVFSSAFDQLRSHPADSADFTLTTFLLLGQNYRVAKVGKFNLAVGFDEDIIRLDIPVDDVLPV